MSIERQHPFLQGSKLLENKLPKSYRIDYEKYIKAQNRGINLLNAYRSVNNKDNFKRSCCQSKLNKLNDYSAIDNEWDYKSKFRQIETSLEEKNELINKSEVSHFIDRCFTSLNNPYKGQGKQTSKLENIQKQQDRKFVLRTQMEKQKNKKELYDIIKDVKYGDLFAANHVQPTMLHEKLSTIRDEERSGVIEDIIDFLDQDLTQYKRKPQRGELKSLSVTQPVTPRKKFIIPALNIENQVSPSQSYISPRIFKQIQLSESINYKKQRQSGATQSLIKNL
eukprot:403353409